ncbi:MAG: hypothetical protein HWD61_13565 [Parachlamydiaceae bacterium]|nr:MAG: hypothetical protein HWD61_13565 [Parachlamydiaceae bacterium]
MLSALFNYIAFGESKAQRRLPMLEIEQMKFIEPDLDPNAKRFIPK